MIRKKVITRVLESNEDYNIIEAPQGNTLYADQFTDEVPFCDEDREGFRPKRIEDVFEHYQPCKKGIVLETEEGETVFEDFDFKSIRDFEDKQLIEHSRILGGLKAKINMYNTLIRQFQSLSDGACSVGGTTQEMELNHWLNLFEHIGKDYDEVLTSFKIKKDKAKECLRNNLFVVHDEIKQLEITYRTLDSFFANYGCDNTNILTLMNVNKSELEMYDSDDTLAIRDELERHYDRLRLNNNYSLLVIPGYLGNSTTIRMWADTAYRNKVIMVTDFKDRLNFEMLKEELDDASLQGQDTHLANVVMTCNYLLGRKQSELAMEDDDVFIPGSAALAGRMTNPETAISIGAAGKKHGTLKGVHGVRLGLRNPEIVTLAEKGLIPMTEDNEDVIALSTKTLYHGSIKGLREYPTIRVFNWISKVIKNFVQDKAYMFWDSRLKYELRDDIFDFLNDYKGPDNLIENFKLKKLDQDIRTKDINIQIELKLFFFQEPYLMNLLFHSSIDGMWMDEISIVS